MRFVDTNVFVRLLAGEETRLAHVARDVFSPIADEQRSFTTSDAVVAEVIFVLTSTHLYQLTRDQVATRLQTIFQSPNCHLTNLEVMTEALFIWQHESKLSFVDALCFATSSGFELELVTFDTALAKVANVVRWDLRS